MEEIKDNKKKRYLKRVILFFLILILITCGLLLYARYISTSGLYIKEYKIINENITDNFHGLKIVHISDIHYGTTINKDNLCELADKINITKPDLVLLTGDLIDKNITLTKDDINDITECMTKINATLGKYIIMGENDYSYENFNTLIENIGFINLNDNYDTIYKDDNNYILLAGISSISNTDKTLEEKIAPAYDYINNSEVKPIYTILMMHEPDLISDIDTDKFNLILAGHSHNGQVIIPFIGGVILPDNAKKYYKEYYKINNTNIYISNGIGTSEFKFRFLNKPSFNLYRLTKK